ncbi:MAG: trimeric intracellular cation channel family protein [Paramuribaculum sp.]|nr:trimeric intracellular cation channel family protein [Paramuribaculum sp.]
MEEFLFIIEMIGTIAAAISGIRLAATKKFDWFGAYTVGLVTAIGGGTLRDILLDIPVFWLQSWSYLAVTALALVTVMTFRSFLVSRDKILFIFDSIGLALFCVIGIEKTLAAGYPMWGAAVMGIITGAFGGVLRDLLINDEPLIFSKDIYATACLAGALVYWIVMLTTGSQVVAPICCAIAIIGLRILALKYNLGLPTLAPVKPEDLHRRNNVKSHQK